MRRHLVRGLLVTIAVLAVPVAPTAAATFTVSSTADAVDTAPGDASCASASNGCTLRAAVQEANALAGADEIDLPAGTYRLTLAGANEDAAATGDLDVTSDVTVVGAGARSITITTHQENSSSPGFDRIFDVIAGGSLTMSKVALDGGQASTGGLIRAAGPLSLTDAMLQNGFAGGDGGAIRSTAAVSLDRVTLQHNTASFSGHGGGISSAGSLTVVNSTLALNSADRGGGIAVLAGTADIANATLAMNFTPGSSSVGGQIYNAGSAQVRNSILERTTPSAPNCGGSAITSGGHNVDDDGSCAFAAAGDRGFNFFGWTYYEPVNAGGGTDVVMPFSWPSSPTGPGPAVDIGAEGCPAADQRGVSRPQGGSCDAGAYEAQFADLAVTATGVPGQVTSGDPVAYSVTITNNGPTPAFASLGFESTMNLDESRGGSPCPPGGACIGTVQPGQSATIDVSGTAPQPGTITTTFFAVNDGPVGQATLDPVADNSRLALSIPVLAKPTPPVTPAPAPQLKPGACANLKLGTKRADALKGTPAGDRIRGLAGNDKISGLAGDDCLDGGAGNDKLTGGPGHDKLDGGPGNDTIDAVDGKRDTVDCGKGRDRATVDRIDRVKGCEKVKRKR